MLACCAVLRRALCSHSAAGAEQHSRQRSSSRRLGDPHREMRERGAKNDGSVVQAENKWSYFKNGSFTLLPRFPLGSVHTIVHLHFYTSTDKIHTTTTQYTIINLFFYLIYKLINQLRNTTINICITCTHT